MTTPVEITIYTTATCPYCRAAKDLLNKKNLAFTEIPVDGDGEARQKMTERANGRTSVPQISRSCIGAASSIWFWPIWRDDQIFTGLRGWSYV
jgi:glutaredoxin